jgi:hypothetical protein
MGFQFGRDSRPLRAFFAARFRRRNDDSELPTLTDIVPGDSLLESGFDASRPATEDDDNSGFQVTQPGDSCTMIFGRRRR